MSAVQRRAEEMISRHGFLGVPVETFEDAGRRQMCALLREGLTPEALVLDVGCGCLRTAYWLVRFLNPGCYFGIEPVRRRVDLGLEYLFTLEELTRKRPRFDANPNFDFSVFRTRFDFVLAGSIWSHACKRQIEVCLDSFVATSTTASVFLSSYIPARSPDEDYDGDCWVGTSHESDTPGVIRHALGWLEEQCRRRRLSVQELPGEAFDGQVWLRVRHV